MLHPLGLKSVWQAVVGSVLAAAGLGTGSNEGKVRHTSTLNSDDKRLVRVPRWWHAGAAVEILFPGDCFVPGLGCVVALLSGVVGMTAKAQDCP